MYRVPGQEKGSSSLKLVRREVVRRFLFFLGSHHEVYRKGIRNPHGSPGTDDEFFVPPFNLRTVEEGGDFDLEALDALPLAGDIDGLHEMYEEADAADDVS